MSHPNSIEMKTQQAQNTANETGRKMHLYERLDGKGYGFRAAQDRDLFGVGTIIWPALLLLLIVVFSGPVFASDPDNDDAHPESSICLPCPPPPPGHLGSLTRV